MRTWIVIAVVLWPALVLGKPKKPPKKKKAKPPAAQKATETEPEPDPEPDPPPPPPVEEEKPAPEASPPPTAPLPVPSTVKESLTADAEKADEPSKPAETPAEPAKPDEPVGTAGYDGGFFIKSGNNMLRFGLESRVQASVFQRKTPDPARIDRPGRFTIRPRSLQFMAYGTAYDRIGYEFSFGLTPNPDRPLDSATIYFANVSYNFSPALTVYAGMFLVPFGIEGSSYFGGFSTIERSLIAQNLAPIRDAGLKIDGTFGKGRLFYSLALVGGSDPGNIDPEDSPDGVLRLQAQPVLGHVMIGASAQVGKQPFEVFGAGAVITNTYAQRDLLFYTPSNGLRQKYGADLLFQFGPWSLRGEAMYLRQQRKNLLNDAGQQIQDGEFDASDVEIMGAYGETSLYIIGAPRKKGVELVAKYERLAAQTKGTPNEVRPIEVNAYTGGINWYIRPTLRVQADILMFDVKRFPTPEFPSTTPDTYLDNAKRYVGLGQVQFWFF